MPYPSTERPAEEDRAPATLHPFACSGCGAALGVPDADVATCRHCRASTPVPLAHREARRKLREGDAERRRAVEAFAEVERTALPRSLGVGAQIVAPALLVLGLAVFAIMASRDGEGLQRVPRLVGVVVLAPLWPLVVIGGFAAIGSVRGKHARLVRVRLSARRGEDGALVCRTCGAPLDDGAGDACLRCLYCGADNLMEVDEAASATLDRAKATAVAELERAVALLRERARAAVAIPLYAAIPTLVLLPVPLAWAFGVGSLQRGDWPLVAADLALLCLLVPLLSYLPVSFRAPDLDGSPEGEKGVDADAAEREALVLMGAIAAGIAGAASGAYLVFQVAGG